MCRTTRMALAISLLLLASSVASALNFTGETGNKATFETLLEAHQNSPAVVRAYQAASMPGPGAAGPSAGGRGVAGPGRPWSRSGRPWSGRPRRTEGQSLCRPSGAGQLPEGDDVRLPLRQHVRRPRGGQNEYQPHRLRRAALRQQGRGACLAEGRRPDRNRRRSHRQHRAGHAGRQDVRRADVAAYYALQTAMLAQQASGVQADGTAVAYSDAEYFGGFGYIYFIGVDGGATFFNNYIATTFDFVSRIAGALLVGGGVDEVRKPSTFVPVYLVNAGEAVVEKYKAANRVNAVKGLGGVVTHYNQALPLQQVVVANAHPVNLAAAIKAAYHDMFIKAMRVPVVLQAMYSAGTPYSGYNMDEAPYSLCERNALINGVTKNGIHLISHQGESRFAAMKSPDGRISGHLV